MVSGSRHARSLLPTLLLTALGVPFLILPIGYPPTSPPTPSLSWRKGLHLVGNEAMVDDLGFIVPFKGGARVLFGSFSLDDMLILYSTCHHQSSI